MIDFTGYKNFEEKFIFYFKKYDIDYTDKIIKDFYIMTEYLLSENKKYNLTSITDIDEIIVKHYIDSVIILKYFDIPRNSKIIDVGTGAGFPGLPLAIIRRDLNITFLDSSNKKINFIKNISQNFNTGSFIFYCGRAENYSRESNVRETYDFAVSRAVAKLNVLCELVSGFINPGGYFIAYKSKNAQEEIIEAKNALKILDMEITETEEFNLSDNNDNKRILIKIKKLHKTSPKYPRNFSDITKNPL